MDAREVAAYWEANAAAWARQVRAGYDVYRDKHNTPAFLAFLPDVNGLRGIDLGCGEGANTRAVAGRGARMTGVDIAPTFLAYATEPRPPRRSASPTPRPMPRACRSPTEASTSPRRSCP
jgi:2-polyprenyl-3-methyl-5-hydroxy-6-metoxy-1,4-benzoquinol methylase